MLKCQTIRTEQRTAGFGYTFFHEGLRDYSKPVGFDEFSGHLRDIIQPLVHQPGDGWQYGVALALKITSIETR